MFISLPLDVATPGIAAGIFALIVFTLVISLIESIILYLFEWGRYGRSLWACILMNLISSVVGIFLLVAMADIAAETPSLWLLSSFLLSVMIEGGVLMLMKRHAARQNWTVALIANLVSYLLIILPFLWWGLP